MQVIWFMFNARMDKDKPKKVMGLIVANLREERGMSRYLLAKTAGVDTSWLRRFEQGKSGVRVETLIAIARGLGMPAADIVTMMENALEAPEQWLAENEDNQVNLKN